MVLTEDHDQMHHDHVMSRLNMRKTTLLKGCAIDHVQEIGLLVPTIRTRHTDHDHEMIIERGETDQARRHLDLETRVDLDQID